MSRLLQVVGGLLLVCCASPSDPPETVPARVPHDLIAEWDDAWLSQSVPVEEPRELLSESFASGTLSEDWLFSSTAGIRPSIDRLPGDPTQRALMFVGAPDREWRPSHVRRSLPASAGAEVEVTVEVLDGGLAGPRLTGPPALMAEALGADKPSRAGRRAQVTRLSRAVATAEWTPPDQAPRWQTLRLTVTLPRTTQRLRLELTAGRGTSVPNSTVAFRNLTVRQGSSIDQALRDLAPVSGVLRPSEHSRLRSVRIGKVQRPAVVHPTPHRWTVPLPPRDHPLRLTTHVGGLSSKSACWSISTDRPTPLSEGCTAPRTWHTIQVEVPRDATELTFSATADPAVPLAWARPRLWGPLPPETRPDIVLVVIDTLRADALTPENAPALSALKEQMVRYRRAVAASSWTLPSLASVMTGQWTGEHGAGFRRRRIAGHARKNSAEWKLRTFTGIDPATPTLAERLQADGYCTQAVVTNAFFGAGYGFQRGFDRFVQYNGNSIAGAELLGERLREHLVDAPTSCEGPQLTVVHLFEPHMPLRLRSDAPATLTATQLDPLETVTETEAKAGTDSPSPRTATVVKKLTSTNKRHPKLLRSIYDTETWHADRALGALLPTLAPPGTGLVLLSDHGEHFGEDGKWGHGSALSDELLRVPLWVRSPVESPPGAVDHAVSLVDVLPTVLSWAGSSAESISGVPLPSPGPSAAPRTLWAGHRYTGSEAWASVHQDSLMIHSLGGGSLDVHTRGSSPRWQSTTRWYHLPAEGYATPSEPPANAHHRVDELLEHIRTTFPGVHLQCDRPARSEGEVHTVDVTAATGTLIRVTPVEMAEGDTLSSHPSRRSLTLSLTHAPKPAWLVVETHPKGDLIVPPSCHAERAGAGVTPARLSSDEVEALEAIGYLGD